MGDAAPSEVAGRDRGADAVAQVKPRLRGVSQEVAAVVFPALGLLLVLFAPASSRVPVAIYTAGVTAMYATSACYHRGRWSISAKQRMRRLDHSMILIGIAATYTPIAAIGLDRSTARALLAAVWGLAAAGIIRVNAIAPGVIGNEATLSTAAPELLDMLELQQCIKRQGKMEDLVGALLFLASDASSYMTGQTICVDGGLVLLG